MGTTTGRIKAISISTKRGTKKSNVQSAVVTADSGIVGDAHAGKWHRQISLLGDESIQKMIAKGATVGPGDFAENITTVGIDLTRLAIGDRLKLGETVKLEITQIGKQCHTKCEIFQQVGDCIMPREGLFARVISGGTIEVGQRVEVIDVESGDPNNK